MSTVDMHLRHEINSVTSLWVGLRVTGANFRAPLPLHVIMTGRDG